MSGHSKWATIHRQKEDNDAKKGAIFTKVGAAISIAVRLGGGIDDPNTNFRLRLAMEKARQVNMPKENIMRAVEKGKGLGEGVKMEEVMYEGFAPMGVAVLVQVLTDNKLRTVQRVREIFVKGGGVMASQGAVGYLFAPKEELIVKPQASNPKSQEEQELEIIDLGIEDIEQDGDQLVVYCDKDKTTELKAKLEGIGFEVVGADLIMKPTGLVEVSDREERGKIESILEKLEELDDVQKVWTNYS